MLMTTSATATDRPAAVAPARITQKVVIVNGNSGILDALDTALDAGHYDVVFVESSQHAYSQIKRVQPDLVILCVQVDSADGFQVLSMLKLDEETRSIPVLTYTTESVPEADEDADEPSDSEAIFPTAKPALRMN
jgi:PleD family two-component response regulator